MEESHDIKMAVIAGASNALNQKRKNFRLSDEEILKDITANVNSIIAQIDKGWLALVYTLSNYHNSLFIS